MLLYRATRRSLPLERHQEVLLHSIPFDARHTCYYQLLLFFSRQLEAIIRISESLAKMRLKPFASDQDVDEALRLFQVSTLDAAMSGNLAGKGENRFSVSVSLLVVSFVVC